MMDPCTELINWVEGVHLGLLPPSTTLLVSTQNSLYRIVVMDGSGISVQGVPIFLRSLLHTLRAPGWTAFA